MNYLMDTFFYIITTCISHLLNMKVCITVSDWHLYLSCIVTCYKQALMFALM